jgi:hypothetical protein
VATVKRSLALAAALALGACGKLQGFGGPAPPLVTFNVSFSGDLTPLRPPGITTDHALRVALVWGAQWLTEPFCILPAESPDAAAVITAGCRDTFGFVPARVDQSAPIAVGGTASLSLDQLPTADLLVGDVTSRVGYGSLVVYDDRNDDLKLDLSEPQHTPTGGDRGDRNDDQTPDAVDIIYGASFLTMIAADERVAYREGAPPAGAFYPRAGCAPPDPGFSIVGASGFTAAAARTATLMGMLPQEKDLNACTTEPASTVVNVAASAPADVAEVGCDESATDGSPRYREPPVDAPDFTGRVTACAHLPSFDTGGPTGADGGVDGGGGASSLIQLVVSGRATDRCKGLTHYVLRGCRESVSCGLPDWDFTNDPTGAIPWWPCPL